MNTIRVNWLVIALVVNVAASALGIDWPQWRGPHRDGKAAGFEAPRAWPANLTRQWSVEVGVGVSTPALVGDRLYVFGRQGGNEETVCLDARTGREIWKDAYETADADGPAGRFPGPRSSPAVAEAKVVTYGVRGVVSCLDAETGKVLWRKNEFTDSLPRFYTSCSPIILNGRCIVQLGGEDGGAIAAYDLTSGETVWKWTEEGTAYASPITMTIDGVVTLVAETDDHLVALDVNTGKPMWQQPYVASGRGNYNAATPIVDGQTIIYSGSNRGVVAAKLSRQGDALSAQELWSNQDNSVKFNSPILKDGLVYGLSARNNIFCIDASSGETVWTNAAASGGDRGFGSIVDAGAVLVALTAAGDLVVFSPERAGFQRVASYKVADDETYAYPIMAGKHIFIKDTNSVTAWSLE